MADRNQVIECEKLSTQSRPAGFFSKVPITVIGREGDSSQVDNFPYVEATIMFSKKVLTEKSPRQNTHDPSAWETGKCFLRVMDLRRNNVGHLIRVDNTTEGYPE